MNEQSKGTSPERADLGFLKKPRATWSQEQRDRAYAAGDAREVIGRIVTAAAAGGRSVTDFLARLRASAVTPELNRDRASREIVGIAYAMGSTRAKGSEIGPEFSWRGIQQHHGVKYDAERDRAAVEAAVAQPHRADASKREERPTSAVDEPKRAEAERRIVEAAQGRPTLGEFIGRLKGLGVEVELNRARTTPHVSGISYHVDGTKLKGSEVGPHYSWPGLQREFGLTYDPERDRAAIESTIQRPAGPAPAATQETAPAPGGLEQLEVADQVVQEQPAAPSPAPERQMAETEVVVKGQDTREHRRELRDLGGRFDPTREAWVFPASKREAAEASAAKHGWSVTEAQIEERESKGQSPKAEPPREKEARSLLVKGADTRDHRNSLKQLGGRWSPEAEGWVFALAKREEVAQLAGAHPTWAVSEIDTPAPQRALLVQGKTFENREFLQEIGGKYSGALHGYVVPISQKERVTAFALEKGLRVVELDPEKGRSRLDGLASRAVKGPRRQEGSKEHER